MSSELIKMLDNEFDRLVGIKAGYERDAFFELMNEYSSKLNEAGFSDTGFSQVTKPYKLCALIMKLSVSLKFIDNGCRYASDIKGRDE